VSVPHTTLLSALRLSRKDPLATFVVAAAAFAEADRAVVVLAPEWKDRLAISQRRLSELHEAATPLALAEIARREARAWMNAAVEWAARSNAFAGLEVTGDPFLPGDPLPRAKRHLPRQRR
jgi:hypothetical protein